VWVNKWKGVGGTGDTWKGEEIRMQDTSTACMRVCSQFLHFLSYLDKIFVQKTSTKTLNLHKISDISVRTINELLSVLTTGICYRTWFVRDVTR
jgi:hypothetical protein